ncbi:duboraya [Brachyistius frenatus]|uniref:duboraya n=1 Tax=Brachyistius frenatus TaxID=100188 RepID=UPI0037E98C49
MEEEVQARRSVAELAGRFKGSAPPHNAAVTETDKPVRRRPPRTLQLPKPHGDDLPPPGLTSPLPAKTKRNSALIEKLQANLALSPSTPSPKSPGFRLLPPAFTLPSPGSAPATTVTSPTSATPTGPVTASPLTEEEGPACFEAPPTVAEGSILSSINKGRARHSIRRRPPSRRHRKSSSGDEVGVANDDTDTHLSSPSETEDKTTGGGGEGGGEGGEVFNKEDETDASTSLEKSKSHEEETKSSGDVKEGENGSAGGEEGGEEGGKEERGEEGGEEGGKEERGEEGGEERENGSSSDQKEKTSADKQTQDPTEGTTEESEEAESSSSAR